MPRAAASGPRGLVTVVSGGDARLIGTDGGVGAAIGFAARAVSALREMDIAPNPALQRLSAQLQRVRPALQQ
jgi:hypothetical protein